MPDTRTYYVISNDNCKFESMTKEQILAAITQAIEEGEISDIDTGFVTKLKEANKNRQLTFWIGSTAEYNALQIKETNCFYILTDDTEFEDIETELETFRTTLENLTDTVMRLSATVSDQEDEITELQTASEIYADKFRIIDAKKDWVLLNTTVQYADETYKPLSMPHDEDLPQMTIADFSVVKVGITGGEILCNVYKYSDTVCYIRGADGGNASTNGLVLNVINLKCSYDDDSGDSILTQNHSIICTIPNGVKAQLEIKKIIGVL